MTADRNGWSRLSGETVACLVCCGALALLMAVGLCSGVLPAKQVSESFKEHCDALGGHVIEKHLLKETLQLCVSGDGRLLE